MIDKNSLEYVLVTDCGSTTTKALLFYKGEDRWHLHTRGEAPTTVEAPVADVTVGALNAFTEIEELSSKQIIQDAKPEKVDLYLSTSSAGGGLQMLVAGIVGDVSAKSAARAALGAGAIVLDTISFDDGREDFEKVEAIRHLKPDIFLLAGGTEEGAVNQVLELAEILLLASPKPRFGKTLKLPVVFAGNQAAEAEVSKILETIANVVGVSNVRPEYSREDLPPAREAIHDLFLEHVMSHSPGYDKLLAWSPVPVLPTPAAVGNMVESYGRSSKQNVLAVDIGGATTDVFSVFKHNEDFVFNRTVSANLGMSYSMANVLIEAGVERIKSWINADVSASEVNDRLHNKMIRPTSIPQTKEDLELEQAVCREALRLSLKHHQDLAVGLEAEESKGIAGIFSSKTMQTSLLDLMTLDVVIGSGGVLSHAPQRLQAAMMLLEGFALEGFTQITVDSVFMLPHLGVFAEVHPAAAREIFLNDCLVNVAHSIVPVYSKKKAGDLLLKVCVADDVLELGQGELLVHPLQTGERYTLRIEPQGSYVDVGPELVHEITAGECGLILDGRNRRLG